MNGAVVTARILIAVIAACLIALIAISIRPPEPTPTTIGKLSERSSDPLPGLYRIDNAGWGARHGVYIVFSPQVDTRRTVVICLAPGESAECESFTGTVSGIQLEPVPGCPCDPPFVYVTGCRSCPAD